MKKILSIFIFMFCMVGIVNATKCSVVTGNKGIGSEVNCNGEHFYVLENDGKEARLFAKYNLYAGMNLNIKEKAVSEFANDEAVIAWCSNTVYEFAKYYRDGDKYYCTYGEMIENTPVRQNEKAIGAHGSEFGKPDFPHYGVVDLDSDIPYAIFSDAYGGGYFQNGIEFTTEDNATYTPFNDPIKPYLDEYLEYLGSNFKNIDLIAVDELVNFVKKAGGKEIPLAEWGAVVHSVTSVGPGMADVVVIGNIKDYIPKGYEWIYSTTYWTKTSMGGHPEFMYLVDTLGNLCNVNVCERAVGAGLRPVVTVPSEDIEYIIETKSDGNGTVKAEKIKAYGGEVIKFTVVPEEGYVLGIVKVTDANGNVVYFKDYTFTMPNANVLIEATFVKIEEKKNPETSDISIVIITIALITASFGMLFIYQQKIKN